MLPPINSLADFLAQTPWPILALNFADQLKKLNPLDENVTIYDFLGTLINVATVLSGLIAVAFAIIGGYKYITATGNPEESKKAISTITWSVIGLILIVSASLIVSYIIDEIRRG
ncbi:MAG: pilin [Patescibacteria group bacterium]